MNSLQNFRSGSERTDLLLIMVNYNFGNCVFVDQIFRFVSVALDDDNDVCMSSI